MCIGYVLTVSLLLKITLLKLMLNLGSLLIQTAKVSRLLSKSDLALKLHGICKQDPLSASISVGVVIKREGVLVQPAPTPATYCEKRQTVNIKAFHF